MEEFGLKIKPSTLLILTHFTRWETRYLCRLVAEIESCDEEEAMEILMHVSNSHPYIAAFPHTYHFHANRDYCLCTVLCTFCD